MKIALDYDNTITADPIFWTEFVKLAITHGHSVTVVTSRHPCQSPPVEGIPVICCAFTAKEKHFQADVWIDDDPAHICKDHVF